jgi:hypothetical protein
VIALARTTLRGTLALSFAIAVGGCGLRPNPSYEPGAVFTREISGNYLQIASCAYDALEKIWAPVQKTDFPERKAIRLSRFTDGTIMKVFQIDFAGTGPKTTKISMDEPATMGALPPIKIWSDMIAPCAA